MSVNTHDEIYPLVFAGLGRVLTHATLAQSLDLKGSDGGRRTPLTLSRMFQGATWQHLKHFGLHGLIMYTDAELIDFFDRHRRTIDSVALRSIFLHEKDPNSQDAGPCEAWKHFFGELRKRSIRFRNLDLFEIYDCCNNQGETVDLATSVNGGATVLGYLRDGGPNPFTRDTVREVSG